jgi:hypothetical protein
LAADAERCRPVTFPLPRILLTRSDLSIILGILQPILGARCILAEPAAKIISGGSLSFGLAAHLDLCNSLNVFPFTLFFLLVLAVKKPSAEAHCVVPAGGVQS